MKVYQKPDHKLSIIKELKKLVLSNGTTFLYKKSAVGNFPRLL